MSKTNKSYCSLYNFIKDTNPGLKDILSDLCIKGLFKTKKDITFLNPNDKLIEELTNLVNEGKSNEAREKLQSLFIYNKHDKLDKDVISYNNKKYKTDLTKVTKQVKYISWDGNKNNVSIFDYTGEKFPEEEDNTVNPPILQRQKNKNSKNGGNDISNKQKITNDLMKYATAQEKNKHSIYIYALNSLINFLNNNDKDTFNKVIPIIDPNMIVSWYIIVQPGKKNPDYIPDNIFNEWVSSITNKENKEDIITNIVQETNKLMEIIQNYQTPQEVLQKIKSCRHDVNNNSVYLKDLIDRIISSYNSNYTKILEDELRFIHCDDTDMCINDALNSLNLIDWNKPEESLVLIKSNDNILMNSGHENCVQNFVNSSAYKYVLINTTNVEKIMESLSKQKEGGGSGNRKKIVKILGNTHRDILKNTKSVNTIDIIESLINHLTSKEKAHLKSIL